jgi:hypothetical protein
VDPISSSSRYTVAPGGCDTTSTVPAGAAPTGALPGRRAAGVGVVARGAAMSRAGAGALAGVVGTAAGVEATGGGMVALSVGAACAVTGGGLGVVAGTGDASRTASSSARAPSRRRSSSGSRPHVSERLSAERAPATSRSCR